MKLRRLATSGFRNLEPGVVDVDAPLVVFWGENGQGKTNLLEAIGVLGTLKSFRASRVAEVVADGATTARVEGLAVTDGDARRHVWGWGPEGRVLRREERAVDAVEWLGSLRATTFAPADVALVRGEPALRRALLDRAVLNLDPAYLLVARDFKRVVEQKAALLRSRRATDALLDVLDEAQARLGAAVAERRRVAITSLSEPFSRRYAEFSGGESAGVGYRSALGEGDLPTLTRRYARQLAEGRPAEREAGRVLGGPQRDDLEFRVGKADARRQASQGQARSLVLAWKLAEVEVAGGHDESPLFLLDDLGSELDPGRAEALVRLLQGLGAQVFVTTTDRRFVPATLDALVLRVQTGRIGA